MFILRSKSILVGAVAITAALAVGGCSRSAGPRSNADTGPQAGPQAAASQPATAGGAGATPAGTSCATEQGWGTGAKGGGSAMTPAALYLARAGRDTCYDRVVFDINGSQAVGFDVRYVPVVAADGSGEPVPVAGHAALQVIVRAPIYGTDGQGHQSWRLAPRVGEHLVAPATLAGWTSLTAVKFAGSFEGQSTIAVGVAERRPFRVSVISEPGYKRVVLDIAH